MREKPHLKVQFTDFWEDFDYMDSFFYKLLSQQYSIEISQNPEILFFSGTGDSHVKYNCTKIFYTGENIRPNFNECDFAFSFDYDNNLRNYRLPLYALYDDVKKLIKTDLDLENELKKKKKFCCFVVSNPCNSIRNNFFLEFSEYRRIDSGGKLFNNIGDSISDKRDFIKDYKFVIAFENSIYPGYVTEKIFEPLLENCVPIYWGHKSVNKDFNPDRFIDANNFDSFKALIDHIIEVDNNDELYLKYLSAPSYHQNIVPFHLRNENILSRIEEIIEFHKRRTLLIKIKHKLRPKILFLHSISKKIFRKIMIRR